MLLGKAIEHGALPTDDDVPSFSIAAGWLIFTKGGTSPYLRISCG
jgi:hypothetical protein